MREAVALIALVLSPSTPIWVASLVAFALSFWVVSAHYRHSRLRP